MVDERGKLSDAQFQARLRDIAKRRERQREEDLRQLMRHDWGRRVAHWIVFDAGRLQAVSFNPAIKGDSSLHTHFAEGRRDLAIDVHNELQRLSPRECVAMMQEQVNAAESDLAIELEPTTPED